MSRRHGVRFARLAMAISLVAVGVLTLAAGVGAAPTVLAAHTQSAASTAGPAKTPMPKAESIPLPTNTFADPLPFGPGVPVVIAILAVSVLMIGTYLVISRGPGLASRLHELRLTRGRGEKAPSTHGPAGHAA
jgi:hypothetical protein